MDRNQIKKFLIKYLIIGGGVGMMILLVLYGCGDSGALLMTNSFFFFLDINGFILPFFSFFAMHVTGFCLLIHEWRRGGGKDKQ